MTDFDSPWKEALHVYFPQFLELLFPEVHHAIDWSHGCQVLESELLGSANTTARRVDVLMEVTMLDGQATCILVHVEVQNQHDAQFAERLFDYHYRIRLHFGRPVCTLVVLGDASSGWRPDSHQEELLGCRHRLDFPVVKLEDFRPGIRSLETSKNPFGPVVAAHLHVRSGGPGSPRRQRVKQRLVRQLHESGFSSDDIRQLYRLIDWFLQLDRVQEEVFWLELRRYERKHEMPYITSVERIGHKKGLEQGLKRGLEQGLEEGLQKGRAEGQMEGHARGVRDSIRTVLTARFGDGCLERLGDLEDVSDPSQLSALTLASATVPSFEDFLTILSA